MNDLIYGQGYCENLLICFFLQTNDNCTSELRSVRTVTSTHLTFVKDFTTLLFWSIVVS